MSFCWGLRFVNHAQQVVENADESVDSSSRDASRVEDIWGEVAVELALVVAGAGLVQTVDSAALSLVENTFQSSGVEVGVAAQWSVKSELQAPDDSSRQHQSDVDSVLGVKESTDFLWFHLVHVLPDCFLSWVQFGHLVS